MEKAKKVLILTDTPLGARGIKNLIASNSKTKVKILSIHKSSIEEIKKFSPTTIICYRYNMNGVGYEALDFFSKQPGVNLITFNLKTNQMETYVHHTVFDAQEEDLFRNLNLEACNL